MKIFNSKPKHTLQEAVDLVNQAVEIAYTYKKNKRYKPTRDDLKLFERLSETLWSNHATAQYIARCMEQRYNGEPEGASKFHDKEAAKYHNIP